MFFASFSNFAQKVAKKNVTVTGDSVASFFNQAMDARHFPKKYYSDSNYHRLTLWKCYVTSDEKSQVDTIDFWSLAMHCGIMTRYNGWLSGGTKPIPDTVRKVVMNYNGRNMLVYKKYAVFSRHE
jgi:hypothetical protein